MCPGTDSSDTRPSIDGGAGGSVDVVGVLPDPIGRLAEFGDGDGELHDVPSEQASGELVRAVERFAGVEAHHLRTFDASGEGVEMFGATAKRCGVVVGCRDRWLHGVLLRALRQGRGVLERNGDEYRRAPGQRARRMSRWSSPVVRSV